MASQVLSGSSNVSYTNNTGQNVRLIIYYMAATGGNIAMTWGNSGSPASANGNSILAIGKDICFYTGAENESADTMVGKNMVRASSGPRSDGGVLVNTINNRSLPIEIMLAPSQIFNATCGSYNIIVITEA